MSKTPSTIPAGRLQELLAASRHPMRDRQLDLIIEARRAADAVIGHVRAGALVPGIEVVYLEAEEVRLGQPKA